MGGSERGISISLLKNRSFQTRKHHHHQSSSSSLNGGHAKPAIPKGYLAIKVGGEGEEQQRFIIPVVYFSHPLFLRLLKEAEEEYGFDQKGTITIPCHVEEFMYVQGMIDKERLHHHHHHHGGHGHGHGHTHNPLVGCFRA